MFNVGSNLKLDREERSERLIERKGTIDREREGTIDRKRERFIERRERLRDTLRSDILPLLLQNKIVLRP